MGFSTVNKNAVLDFLFGAAAMSSPAEYYVALSTTPPTDSGANVSEPAGGSYARIGILNTGAKWVAASAGEKANADDIIFPTAAALWGTIGWWCLYDAVTYGTMHHWGILQTARVIDIGDQFRFLAGDLIIRLRSE